MEWDVGPGRGAADGVSLNAGAGMDAGVFQSFRDDEDSQDAPAFNFDLKRFVFGVWQRRYIGFATEIGRAHV